jgi:F0F1-type ATP synthase membrane subunit b/b'
MTKEQEIAIIREFAAKLGENSYFGPVLTEALPELEQDIKNDITPYLSLRNIRDEALFALEAAKQERATAEIKAERIVLSAREEAERIVTSAREYKDTILAFARNLLIEKSRELY